MLLAHELDADAEARTFLDPLEEQPPLRLIVAVADLEIANLLVDMKAESTARGGLADVIDARLGMTFVTRRGSVDVVRFLVLDQIGGPGIPIAPAYPQMHDPAAVRSYPERGRRAHDLDRRIVAGEA
jgi:hypothetical protein